MLGGTEYVAEACEEQLNTLDHQVNLHLKPHFTSILNNTFAQKTTTKPVWLICTSTHGAGDLPDNIQPFAAQLKNLKLPNHCFLVVGLGDSNYDTYCHGSIQIEDIMLNTGAKLLSPALHIDVVNHPIPEDAAVKWLKNWLKNNEQPA